MCPQYGIYFNRGTVRCPRIGIGIFSSVHKMGLGSNFMSTSMGTLYISNLAGKVNDFFAILHMDKKHWFWQNRNEKELDS